MPRFSSKWVAYPPRMKRDVPFSPKPENQPVGNVDDVMDSSFYDVWWKMFKELFELALKYTDLHGRQKHGLKWRSLNSEEFLSFNSEEFRKIQN